MSNTIKNIISGIIGGVIVLSGVLIYSNFAPRSFGVSDGTGRDIISRIVEYQLVASDTAIEVASSTGGQFYLPYDATVRNVWAYNNDAGSGSASTFDINEDGTSILSTVITIDDGEKHSKDSATPAVISDTLLDKDNPITYDVDTISSGTAPNGLTIGLELVL